MRNLTKAQKRLFVAALEVAIAPTEKAAKYVYSASVPWHRVDELREAFDAAGIDWRAVKAEQATRDREARAEKKSSSDLDEEVALERRLEARDDLEAEARIRDTRPGFGGKE